MLIGSHNDPGLRKGSEPGIGQSKNGKGICPEKIIDRTGYSTGAFGDEPTEVASEICAWSLGNDNNNDRKVEKEKM